MSQTDSPLARSDSRWAHALDGLRVMTFASQEHGNKTGEWFFYGEVTGIEGHYVFVVIDGDDEPQRLHWTQLRPL